MDILIYTESDHWRNWLVELLQRSGHRRLRLTATQRELTTELQRELPGLVLVYHEPPRLDGLPLAQQLFTGYRLPALLAVPDLDATLAEQALRGGYAALLSMPATAGSLQAAISTAVHSQARHELLADRVAELERRLAERKLIERAKGLLMERDQLSEEQAFRTLRSQSMARRLSMASLARMLLEQQQGAKR